ncbi:MAG: hypothetical protein ACREOZ_04200, partial [Gloeomargaritales cyanobacterium]
MDLKNMFNSISRKKARHMLCRHFPQLVGLFDLMYLIPAKVWVQLPRGEWEHILQIEGFPQGCPLSPFFAALVLHGILTNLDGELRERAETRRKKGNTGDDEQGGITDLFAFLDDTQTAVPYDDLLFLFRRFVALGAPLGCLLAQGKCKILTSTCGVSPRDSLSVQHQNALNEALHTYCGGLSGELLEGTRLLGYPLGNATFARSFIQDALADFKTSTTALHNTISDPQLRFSLFKTCIQPKIAHVELPDVLYSQGNAMETSEFTETSTSAIHDFLTTLLHGHDPSKQLSTLSQLQAIQPVGKGGLGLRSTQDSRMGRFLIPTIKSIRQTLDDLPLPAAPTDDDHPPLSIILPDSLKNVFQPWQKTNVKLVAVVD